MMPKVVLLGRPNVGKSTLFNRLIRSNRAITHDRPGVTRDRMEGVVRSRFGRDFALVDTGGITLDSHHAVAEGPAGIRGFEAEILRQAEIALKEADVVCMVADGRDGLMPFDEHLASYLRRCGRPVLLVVNKVDGAEREDVMLAEFHGLGFPLIACSAEHGHNLRALEEEIRDMLPEADDAAEEEERPAEELEAAQDAPGVRRRRVTDHMRLCLLGCPNAGKSSMTNAFLGEERMIVSDQAGTTRDSVDVSMQRGGRTYTFVDTAGVRRRSRITDTVERFSVNSSLKSTTKADVTLLLIDAVEGLTAQDKRLIELLDERKTPFLIVVNKIDLIPLKARTALMRDFKETLGFCSHVPVVPASARTGEGLDRLIPLAERIYAECGTRVSTGLLNRAMEETLARHQAPVVRRVRPKFFYLTQAESEPPTFVCFVNDAGRVAESYVRYLEKSLRRIFGIRYAPMRLHLRSSHEKKERK
ncbi:ribosome biogenesis GTPase Der [uncultured Mailhella sp.]|uniref:ribosome biogenesis GTPase Der n=1 Tax=uncultured Mailhella sp. TaxID=1981031 RepID=UPI002613288D|nr:ribosome biogenesis GTPase Der [uncultured Mailhella sp.]